MKRTRVRSWGISCLAIAALILAAVYVFTAVAPTVHADDATAAKDKTATAPKAETEVKTAAAEATEPPENAAAVNGQVIPYDTFTVELEMHRRRLQQQGQVIPDQMLPVLRSQVLESLINQELLFQESVKKGIKPKQGDVDKEMADLKERFGDKKQFEDTLANMKMTEEELRQQIAQRSAIRHLVDTEIGSDVDIKDAEAQSFYKDNPGYFQQPEQVHARHILIKVSQNATNEDKTAARKKIDDIKKRIDKGEDFGELARTESEGPSSTKGGDLGYFSKGRMVKPFEEAAFAMQPNEVSDVVETQFGYHLIQTLDRKPAQTVAFEEVKERIVANLRNQQIQEKVMAYLETLKKTAKIERFVQ